MAPHGESDAATAGGQAAEKLKSTAQAVISAIHHEDQSEAHRIFRSHPGHNGARRASTISSADASAFKSQLGQEEIGDRFPAIQHPGSTGVIYVTDRATSNGFYYGNPEWANLGQGAPEVGNIEGGAPRTLQFDLSQFGEGVHEYAPNTGTMALRKAVANYYNQTFRQNRDKKFDYSNVCIVPGGRAGWSSGYDAIGCCDWKRQLWISAAGVYELREHVECVQEFGSYSYRAFGGGSVQAQHR